MKNILVVDDERPFLLSLKDGLLSFSDRFNVVLASDGRQALRILSEQRIDLLVTDLKLPIMDGFQLLAHVSRTSPNLPIIVMTAFGTPEIEERLAQMNTLHYLEKPLDFDQLAQTIIDALDTEARSYIRGITLATFLQLVHMEQKSCTLKIRSKNRVGYLFIQQGELFDAQTGELAGEPAALEIIAWDDTEIEMDSTCRRSAKTIQATLEFVLMEAYRLKDEASAATTDTHQQAPQRPEKPAPQETEPNRKLLEALNGSRAIKEFAIFDDANFLEHHSEEPCSLSKLDPTYYLSMIRTLDDHLDGGDFRYLLFTTESRHRYLIFRRGRRRVVLAIADGAKPAGILDQLSPALF